MAWVEKNKDYLLLGKEMEILAYSQKRSVFARPKENGQGLWAKFNFFFRKEKTSPDQELEFYKNLAKRDGENPRLHLKLAELYLKRQERRKATSAYLTAAQIFLKNGLLPQAMAVYKRMSKENPDLEEINWKIAEVYRQMGFLGDAFRQYNRLLQQYEFLGVREKVQEIMELMVDIDPQKFMLNVDGAKNPFSAIKAKESLPPADQTLPAGKTCSFFDLSAALQKNEAIEFKNAPEVKMDHDFGFRQIVEELRKSNGQKKIYPNFYYHLGVACWEMGFVDEAIENLQEAIKEGEDILATAKLMSKCYKEKGWWEEARESLQIALQKAEVTEEEREKLKKEMQLITSELNREKQVLGMLNTNFSDKAETMKKRGKLGYKRGGLGVQGAIPA